MQGIGQDIRCEHIIDADPGRVGGSMDLCVVWCGERERVAIEKTETAIGWDGLATGIANVGAPGPVAFWLHELHVDPPPTNRRPTETPQLHIDGRRQSARLA